MAGSNHGHTPAAWTGATICFIGFCVAGVFMVAANPLGFWAGMAIIPIGGVVGLAMKAAGLGMPKEPESLTRARAAAGQKQPEAQTSEGQTAKSHAPEAQTTSS
ncbi:HGxxPAAW family protein [Streptomyces sp. NPDC052236]|uniref:HGxxPAAW family protein n=1 Tax=Streptomyces sp. NPDC052236 TaxID=3365686 RepID=UPI0037D0D2F2